MTLPMSWEAMEIGHSGERLGDLITKDLRFFTAQRYSDATQNQGRQEAEDSQGDGGVQAWRAQVELGSARHQEEAGRGHRHE